MVRSGSQVDRGLVDTLGTVLLACVSPANVDDHDGAEVLPCKAAEVFPRLRHVWADACTGVSSSR